MSIKAGNSSCHSPREDKTHDAATVSILGTPGGILHAFARENEGMILLVPIADVVTK